MIGIILSNESSASTHICKFPSRYNLAYSNALSIASDIKTQSDQVWFLEFFLLPNNQYGYIARIKYINAVALWLYSANIVLIIHLLMFNQSWSAKIKKAFQSVHHMLHFYFVLYLSYRFSCPYACPYQVQH